MPDLSETIQQVASGPAKASGDGQSAETHKLESLMAADQYLAAKEAAKHARRGLRFTKLIRPGAQ